MRTIQDRVIVEPIFADQLSAAGIYLGEGEMTNSGTVLAVGPGRKTEHTTIEVAVKVGDVVHFTADAGHRTQIGRKKILVLREQDIFAVQE